MTKTILRPFLLLCCCWAHLLHVSDGLCPPTTTRRTSLEWTRKIVCGYGLTLFLETFPAHAASPMDMGESVRRAGAYLPGLGPTDIFYPLDWKGTWKVTRQVSLIPPGPSKEESKQLTLQYKMRFLPSIEDDRVVADRGFNQVELETAIARLRKTAAGGTADGTSQPPSEEATPPVRSVEWSETNPNDLRLVLADGQRKEIKVTKRASGDDGWSSSSEFQRLLQEDSRGIPTITARRVLTKWKVMDSNTLEGMELIYDMGGGGDPMAARDSRESQLLSKSRMLLERI